MNLARVISQLKDAFRWPLSSLWRRIKPYRPPDDTPRDYYVAAHALLSRARIPGDLTAAELRVSSENGEDGVIAEIIARVGCGDPPYFVEFGIGEGTEGNCIFLADFLRWHGLFLEPANDLFQRLSRKYGPNPRIATHNSFVTPNNADLLFADAGVPAEPDVLSIDVDGNDYWIWQSIESLRPRLVVIEYNSSLPADSQLVQPLQMSDPWDGTAYFGASLGALRALANKKDYRLVHTEVSGVNAFFVRSDLPGDWLAEDDVAARGPNYRLKSRGHPDDELGRPFIDVSQSD